MEEFEHGTTKGYDRFRCRCDLCRKANRIYKNEWARKRKEKGIDPSTIKHGTDSGYGYSKCRCVLCKAAHAEKNKGKYEENKLTSEEISNDSGLEHGIYLYSRGCRCDVCRSKNSKRLRDFRKKHNPEIKSVGPRDRECPGFCSKCGVKLSSENTSKMPTGVGGLSPYCKPCDRVRAMGQRDKNPNYSFKQEDKKKGRDNDLTTEFTLAMYEKPCFYCGSTRVKMSLDRIDNSLGHLQSNVNPCCVRCNGIRRHLPYEAWILFSPMLKKIEEENILGNWYPGAKKHRLWKDDK